MKWDNDGRGLSIQLKTSEKYSAFLSFRAYSNSIRICLIIYAKRDISGKIVFELFMNLNEFEFLIKSLQKLSSLLNIEGGFSIVNELDKVIMHLKWLRNYIGGGGNE